MAVVAPAARRRLDAVVARKVGGRGLGCHGTADCMWVFMARIGVSDLQAVWIGAVSCMCGVRVRSHAQMCSVMLCFVCQRSFAAH